MHNKEICFILSLVIAMSFLPVNNNTLKAQEKKRSERIYAKISVEGLACPFCAYGVEKKIMKLEGAKNYDVNMKKGLVYFDVPKAQHPSKEELKTAIRQKIKNAGFSAREMTLKAEPFEKAKEGGKTARD